jgi:hypothetical protein
MRLGSSSDSPRLPDSLSINAWDGNDRAVSGAVHDVLWGLRSALPQNPKRLFAKAPPDMTDWSSPLVGWGLVLPDNPDLAATEKANAVDAPEPIRELLSDRSEAPVFRYLKDSPNRFGTLIRHLKDGRSVQPDIARSKFGVAEDCIPYYLLICASPSDVPWDLQYALNTRFAVGRLDLDDAGLANYVAALRRDWDDSDAQQTSIVVWATDHGRGDMSRTMRLYVANPLWNLVKDDPDAGPGSVLIDPKNGGATVPRLLDALAERKPGMVVTTSHGVTYPLNDPRAMSANLGLPVGDDRAFANPREVLESCDLYSAIWYAHACCSAGSRGTTVFDGLLERDSPIDEVLRGVAAIGSLTAPLPRALLGAVRPLRAFIGHVEPTFDWTISQPMTRQALTGDLTKALWTELFREGSCPVGHAFRSYFQPIGTLASQQVSLKEDFRVGGDVSAQLLAAQLSARDLMSTVILGDPTVRLRFS